MNKLFKNIKGVGQNFKQAWTVLAKQKKLAKTERILSIFEKKRKQIEKEQDYFPTKLEKIQKSIFQQRKKSEVDLIKKQQKLQSNYEKQLKKARLEEHRRIIRLKKAEIALRAKENFVRRGGTKVTWSAFRDIDQKLKIKFSWYEKWHLNPISPKVHSFALASYLVLISFVTANLIEWPSASKAKNIGERKSAVISEITDGNIFSNIQNSERVLSSTTAKVTFAPTGQDAKVEIQAKSQDNAKTKAINFTVLQPSNLVDQSVSEGEKNLSFKSRLINLFSKAEAQEPDEAISTTPESALISPTAAATSSATVSPNASPTVEPNQKSVKAAKTESISKKDNLTTVKVNDYLDLQYEFVSSPSQTKLKETAVIKDKAALVLDQQYNLAFNFDFGDLIAEEQTDNSFLLKDSAGQTIMQIAAPTIWDANKTAGKVKLALDNTAKQAIYRIDSSFVDSAKFPLYLDPTVTIDSNVTTTNPNSYAKDKTLFQTTDGTLIKIYSDGSSLYYRTSTDTGSNWSSSTKILDSATVDDNGFSGWIDPFNNIHLAYSHNGTDSYIFYRKISYSYSDGTISVSDEQTVESGGTSQMYPSVSATETGTTYVAYRYYDGSNYSIKVKSYDGSSWSDSLQTATNADSGVYPVLINWDDRPALIYKEANSIKWNYYASAWKANGWTNESITSEVDSDTGLEFSAIESVDNNYLHLTWRGSGTKGILYKQNTNAEAGWDTNATEITSDHNDRYPSIGSNKNNLVQIYFTDNNGSNNDVKYVQKVSSGSFASAVSVTTDGSNNIYPSALQSALFARNNAATFDGTDDYVDMPDGFADFTGGLTFEFWAYPTAVQNWARFIEISNGAPNNNIFVSRNSTTTSLTYRICNGTATCTTGGVTATNALELNKWQHFVVTESAAGTVTIYKDGVSIATGTLSIPNNVTRANNYLGKSAFSSDSYYKGQMDSVRIYNRAITSSEVTAHYQSGLGPSRFTSDTNLLAGYNFDEISGTSATDVSGNGYTATLTNGVTRSANILPYTNSVNYATVHNDSASYINVPAASSTNLDTTLTMSAWVRVNSDTGWHWIIGKAGGDWLGLTTDGYLNFSIAAGTDRTSTTAYVMDDNWHHVAATVTGGTIKLYLDGYNTDTWTGQTLTAKTGATYIGYNGIEYFNGAINEAKLYTTALSDAQILAQFQAGLFATGAPETGLAGGWSMNEGSGTTLADFSGNNNTGSVVGTITFENVLKNTSNNVPASFISGSSSPYALKFAPKAKTWIGGTDDKWSTAANWSDSTVPAAGDYVYLTNSGTIIADSVADAIDTIEVNSGGGIYFNKHPSLNADTFKINLTGSLIINNATIRSEGDVTVAHDGVTDGRGNEFAAANIIIGSSATIDLEGLGFTAQKGPGKSTSAYIGASYGGEGYGAANTTAYGDYSNPVNLGSGGTGSRGGGAIILTVTGAADLSGTISANGQSGDWNQSAGSGGSVNITAATITGNGTVTANGGSTAYYIGVGGGGRIKLAADSISSSLTLQAKGGQIGSYYGSAGTIYKKTTAQTYGDLIVDNGDNTPGLNAQKMAHLKTSADTGSYQFDNITFANYGLLAVDASQTLALNSGTITGDKNSGVVNAGTVTVPDSWTLSHMYSDKGGTITNASGKSLTISSTGRLTHYQNNDQETYKLNLTLASLTVQSGGEINADYVGYYTQKGPGKSTSKDIGASHGGEGYGAASSTVYDDYSNPVNLGSGGTAGCGGGAIILTVTGTADLSGTISANGQSGGWYQSDGSGGSVNITAASITGNGTITANGGASQTYNGVASGGRIKLAADSISGSLTLHAKGGKYSTYYGSAGTIYKKTTAQTYGDLIIDNGDNTPATYHQYTAHLKTSADTGSYQFDNITFANYGLLAVDAGQTLSLSSGTITGDKNSGVVNAGTVTVPDSWTLNHMYSDMNGTVTNLSSKSLTISSTGRLTHYANIDQETYKLNWTVSALTVQSGGEINADYVGYAAQNGPGKSTSAYIGASYGGEGYGAASSTVYGDYSNPVNLGSGGSAGRGGGAIVLTVTGAADLSGTISANGQSGGWYQSDGSGGSVNITATSITGNGTVTADGGTSQTYNGVASGGRIKLAADSISGSLTLQAKGGKYGAYYGSAGTIYKKITAQTYGDLIIDNSTNTPATRTARVPLTLPLSFDNLTVTNYASLEISTNADPAQNNFAVSNDLVVAANSELQLLTDRDGTPASGAWPIMTVGNNATVSGTISATGAGFTYNSGPGAGKISGSYGSGGGYGGAGGASSNGATGGATYGSQTDNNYLGSGGGYTTGGSGGGMIKLTVAGTLDLSSTGSLTANGNGGTAGGGGGSGGSIQLVAGTLSGTAGSSITVNGGAGGSNGGGGGGGRITIYPANDSYSGIKTATGGAAGTSAVAGSDGTVFVQHSPSSLTMNAPNDAATGQIQKTVFRINSTDVEGDWIQYKLQVATDSSFTQNVSTFDQTVSQNPTDGGRTAIFSNQDKTTGNVAGTDGYSSGREAILTMQTNLTQGTTYYWRFYGYDPEGVDSFDGTKHWSNASATRSFTIAAIDHVSFSTAQQDIVVTFCSAVMTVNLRDSANNEMYLTNDDGAKTINLATTSETGAFYSDGSCQNAISNNNLNIAVGENSASFYYKDTAPSAVNSFWNITAAESPSAGWTDASQNIRVRPGDFGSLEISIAGSLTQVTAGVAFSTPANDVTVTAKDIFGNVKSDWTGQVWFYSSDSQAAFTYNDSNRYTFTSGDGSDNGTHTFIGSGFVFKTKGSQSLVVHNSVDSQYDAITDITVLCAGADHFSLADYPRTASNKFAMSSFAWDVSGYSSAPYSPAASVYDAYNNLIDNFTGEVWFELYKANDTPGNPLNSTADYAFDYDHTNHYTFTTGEGMDNGTHTFDGSGFTVVTAANDLRLRVATTANSGKYTDFTITVKPQAIDHFTLTASPTLSLNGTDWEKANDTAFTESVILTAYDAFGNVKTDYAYDASSKSGMVYFSSSDTFATLPYTKSSLNDTSKCFNFPAESAGSYTFTPENTPTDYFKFLSGGPQTISVSECIDPTSTYYETRYDPKFESNNPLKTIASTGQLPAANGTPSKVYVSQHIPGSTHTAADHTNNSNDLVEAAPGHQQATLSWYNPFDFPTDANIDAQVYIYRCQTDCDNNANFSKLTTDPAKVTATPSTWSEYTDTGLTNDNLYYYKLAYAYLKQDSTYMVSDYSATVSVTPADIAPREVTADQLDLSENATAAGKVKIDYKLRWTSTVSIAYFNPTTNTWKDASSAAQSGDIGANITGDETPISHVAYFDPRIDFPNQNLTESFKVRIKVVVNSAHAYSDSSAINLDSGAPTGTSLIINASDATLTLHLTASDTSSPITMMISNTDQFTSASWQAFNTTVSSYDAGNAEAVYIKLRDNYNNIVSLSKEILPTVENVQIKDASNSNTSEYRLAIIWSAVSINNFKQYKIYRATDGKTFSLLGNADQNGYLDMNLAVGTNYSYKVATEDTDGNISRVSTVVTSSPGTAPDVTSPPSVELFGWKQDVGVRAKITWHTDQLSDSFVAYSTEPLLEGSSLATASGQEDTVKVVGLPDMKSDHEVTLYNLDPSVKYYYKVLSKNEIQITGYSQVFDFTTPERILLLISGTNFSDITNNSAIVSWTTSKLSTTVVEYGQTTNYDQEIVDATLNTEHKFQLQNLNAGQYHLRIKATDTDGNTTISDDYVFEIPPTPVISDVTISEVGETTAKVSWKTNIEANSNVDFGESTQYGGSQGSAQMTTDHIVTLIGLSPKTVYHISARSIDKFGNVANGSDMTFTTTADTEAPQILNAKSEITSTGTGENVKFQLIVSWETNEPATSKVEYGAGMGDTYDSSSKEDLSLNVTHTIIVNDLRPNSLYHFRIKSADRANNTAYSDDYTFTTPQREKNILVIIYNAVAGPFVQIWQGVVNRFK